MMKYTPWLLWRKLLACGVGSAGNRKLTVCATAVAMLFFALSAQAQTDAILPPIGGSGGANQFVLRCPESRHLTGFELRVGDDVDAIQPICVSVYGPAELAGPPEPYYANWGGNRQLVCPRDFPVVTGMYVRAVGDVAVVVHQISLICATAAAVPERKYSQGPKPGFIGPGAYGKSVEGRFIPFGVEKLQTCGFDRVAVGINGRTGYWLDAVGLICGAPKLTPRPNALGRVKITSPTAAAPTSICDSARDARARNSPAAPGLEEKCRAAGAAGEKPPPLALGRVKVPAAGTLPTLLICEASRGARARNSPAAPGLEAQCRAYFAAKGAAIAQVDEIVAEARGAAEADALYQQGFDIATGIFGDPALGAQGNTATGPGSLGIRDSLTAAGQRGFNASVTLHLSRNYKP
ncbi:MAG: hypothetical protein ABI857_01495 [Acidobacteriota bacterium]